MKKVLIDLIHFFINHIVTHIPFWNLRKFFLRLAGMRIGKNSRILMGCYFLNPWSIVIGSGTYINENCLLDGRGNLIIGDNVSISMRSSILTGTHNSKSPYFEYEEKQVVITDYVWTGIASTVLPGVILPKGMVLAAGSVAIPDNNKYDEFGIYSGVPAVKISERDNNPSYKLYDWKPMLR